MERQLVGIDRGRDRKLADRADRDGVAVGRLALHVLDREPSAGAGAVLDHHRLAEDVGKLRPDDARHTSVPPPAAKPRIRRIGLFG